MARIAIIGGGISGLSLAYFLLQHNPSEEIVVCEAEKRPGGKIWTDRADGFLCEWGVNGFLDNRPKTIALARDISLEPLRSNEASRKRFIFSDGDLQRLPETPPSFLTSPLLSLPGRLRVMAELFIPGNAKEEETLAAFAQRRLGREAYEKLIDPMASGIYAGDPETLSLRACFPKVYDLEVNYGGLIRGMLKLQRAKKKQGSREKVGAGPGGVLTSFHGGMEELIHALRAELGDRIRVNHETVSIMKKNDGYDIAFSDDTHISAEIAVLAVPAYASSKMLKSLDQGLADVLAGIPYPSLSVVCFGYKKDKIKSALDGFGYLVPSREQRKILGTLWDSSIFPDRAPEGFVLLRSMVGGARSSDTARLDDSKLIDIVRKELNDIMDITAFPDLVRIYRHEKAIPQYITGHRDKLNQIDHMVLQYRNLYITGNALRGIGVNDCIENSFKLAERISGNNGWISAGRA